jgi:hypothetical protein
VIGKGATLTTPELPLAGTATAQLVARNGAETECWSVAIGAPKNDETKYKGIGP